MFEVPGSDVKSVHITEDCVKGLCAPEYIRHSASATDSTTTTSTDDEESTQWKAVQ